MLRRAGLAAAAAAAPAAFALRWARCEHHACTDEDVMSPAPQWRRGWEAASAPAHAAAAARNAADGEVVRAGADAAGGRRREFEAAVVPTMAVLTDELEAATRWRDEARATLGQERLKVDAAVEAEAKAVGVQLAAEISSS